MINKRVAAIMLSVTMGLNFSVNMVTYDSHAAYSNEEINESVWKRVRNLIAEDKKLSRNRAQDIIDELSDEQISDIESLILSNPEGGTKYGFSEECISGILEITSGIEWVEKETLENSTKSTDDSKLNSDNSDKSEVGPGVSEDKVAKSKSVKIVENTYSPSTVVSESALKVSGNKPRVTEVYSINNNLSGVYWRPKSSDIPALGSRVLKQGKFAAAYTGFFDLNYSDVNIVPGSNTRAMNVLGKDSLLSNETYDPTTGKYTPYVIGDNVSEASAIMSIYKALGKYKYNIVSYIQPANFTQFNSPASNELSGAIMRYKSNSENVDIDAFTTYVFASRSDPNLYLKQFQLDTGMSASSSDKDYISYGDFICYVRDLMDLYGEPRMSNIEVNKLLQYFGYEYPIDASKRQLEAWLYLKSRGILVDDKRMVSVLQREDMLNLLLNVADKDAREDFKEVQLVANIDDDLINKGYFPMQFKLNQETLERSNIDYTTADKYNYLIEVSDNTIFKTKEGYLSTNMFMSNNPLNSAVSSSIDGSSYIGTEYNSTGTKTYYHFLAPIDLNSTSTFSLNGVTYVGIDSMGSDDTPGIVAVPVGGGTYSYGSTVQIAGKTVTLMTRESFKDGEFKGYSDAERVTPGVIIIEDQEDVDVKEDDVVDVIEPEDSFDANEYSNPLQAKTPEGGKWSKDDTGKWRWNIKAGEYLSNDFYLIDGKTYCFDDLGYIITHWVKYGNYWLHFNESDGSLDINTNTHDGYKVNEYGYWVDNAYVDDSYTKQWGWLVSTTGEWQKDSTGWWFLKSDGGYCVSECYLINGKIYNFDNDGYLSVGWTKYDGNWYYFDNNGEMLANCTIDNYVIAPDGKRMYKVSSIKNGNTWYYSMWKEVCSMVSIVAYADTNNYLNTTNKKLSSNNNNITTIISRLKSDYSNWSDAVTEAENSGLEVKVSTDPIDITKNIIYIKGGTENDFLAFLTPTTKSNSNYSNYKIADQSGDGSQVSGAATIGGNMLISYKDAEKALLCRFPFKNSDGIPITEDGKTGRILKFTASGWGGIIINKNNNTITVGTTIYKLFTDDNTVLFTYTTGEDGSQDLLIDIRALYGWSNATHEYLKSGSGNDKLYTVNVALNKKLNINRTTVKINEGSKSFITRTDTIIEDNLKTLNIGMVYPTANWAVVKSVNPDKGSESAACFIFYPKDSFESMGVPNNIPGGNEISSIGSWTGEQPIADNYVVRKVELKQTSSKTPGTFTYDDGFGYAYIIPSKSEYSQKDYLQGKFLLPMYYDSTGTIHCQNFNYIEGQSYDKPQSVSIGNMIPAFVGTASLLSSGVSNSRQMTSHLSNIPALVKIDGGDFLTVGSAPISKIYSSNGKYKLTFSDGSLESVKYNLSITGDTEFFVADYISSSSGVDATYNQFYAMYPSGFSLTVNEDTSKKLSKPIVIGTGILDMFSDYELFKFNDWVSGFDGFLNTILVISIHIVPFIFYIISIIVFGLSLSSNFKFVKWLFHKWIDPIKVLTFGIKSVDDAYDIYFIINIIIVCCASAMIMDGNIIRIFQFLFYTAQNLINMVQQL